MLCKQTIGLLNQLADDDPPVSILASQLRLPVMHLESECDCDLHGHYDHDDGGDDDDDIPPAPSAPSSPLGNNDYTTDF